MVLIVPRRERVGGGYVGAGQLGVLVRGLVWAFIVARVTRRASVVGTRRMMGSRGMIFFTNKATKVASTH